MISVRFFKYTSKEILQHKNFIFFKYNNDKIMIWHLASYFKRVKIDINLTQVK